MAKSKHVEVPNRFHADGEEHRYVQRFKKSWVKRYRPTRSEEVFEAVDLAHFLAALEREDEATALLEFVTDGAAFKGNFNLWTPMGYALVSLAWLRRRAGDDEGASRALDPLRETSFRVAVPTDEPRELVEATPGELDNAANDTQKWGCLALSRHLMKLLFLTETARSDFAHSGSYPTDALDAAVATCLEGLRSKLG